LQLTLLCSPHARAGFVLIDRVPSRISQKALAMIAAPAPTSSRPSTLQATSSAGEYLTFRLGSEEYGIDILRVQEIRSYEHPTRLAHSPDFIKGVIDLRGRIVPILDLRLKLGCPEANYTDFTVVIILDIGGTVIGAVVDAVADVVSLAPELIKPAPQFERQGNVDPAFVTGIASLGDRMLIVMDIEALLSSDEIGLVKRVAAS
jgi:purine-binding chemotaxis protein CheW